MLPRKGLFTFARAVSCRPVRSRWSGLRWIVMAGMVAAIVGAGARAEAKGKGKSKPAAVAKKSASQGHEEIAAGHRVAVFTFDGEDTYGVRDHVVQALKDRGLHVDSSLRPVDTAEQYRDMGAALNISLYVHGKVKQLPADRSTATIVVRSAVSGQKLTSATFNGFRRGLPYDVEEKLWAKIKTVVARACVEASKPGRRHNKPMVIEAGTPL
jgi:hypothetical protein